jgi:phosphoribosyl-dephospho-CoA transferase
MLSKISSNDLVKSYDIKANQVTNVAINDELMCQESEIFTNNGITSQRSTQFLLSFIIAINGLVKLSELFQLKF